MTKQLECGNCRSKQARDVALGVRYCPNCGAFQDMRARYSPELWQAPSNPRASGHGGGVGEYVYVLEPVSPGVGRVVARGNCTGMCAVLGDLVYYRAGDEAECGSGQVAITKGAVLRWETPDEPAFQWGLLQRDGTWHAWVSCGGLEKTVDLGLAEMQSVRVTQASALGSHAFCFHTSTGSVTVLFDEDELR